jgi:hypothetical protein
VSRGKTGSGRPRGSHFHDRHASFFNDYDIAARNAFYDGSGPAMQFPQVDPHVTHCPTLEHIGIQRTRPWPQYA